MSVRRVYYGWVIVLTLSITELISWGALYYSFGVLLTPMQTELGWSRATLAGGFSLGLLTAGLAALPLGRWVDRRGPRALMTGGAIAGVLLLLALARVQDLVAYYLIWAGIGLASAATLYEPAFAAVATWFRRLRSRALAVLTFFGGLASLAFIPLTERLIGAYGWRGALDALALIVAVGTILPHALLLRRAPADLGLMPDGDRHLPDRAAPAPTPEVSVTLGAALRSGGFWWLAAAFSLTTFAVVTLNVHLVSYLIESGQTSGFAALAAGAHGLLSVTGRLTLAPMASRMALPRLLAGLFVMQALSIVALVVVPAPLGVLLYVLLFGMGSGASTPVRAALVADRYGPASYGRINGALTAVGIWARVAAPVGAGLLSALIGYPPLLWGLAIASAVAAGMVAWIARIDRRAGGGTIEAIPIPEQQRGAS